MPTIELLINSKSNLIQSLSITSVVVAILLSELLLFLRAHPSVKLRETTANYRKQLARNKDWTIFLLDLVNGSYTLLFNSYIDLTRFIHAISSSGIADVSAVPSLVAPPTTITSKSQFSTRKIHFLLWCIMMCCVQSFPSIGRISQGRIPRFFQIHRGYHNASVIRHPLKIVISRHPSKQLGVKHVRTCLYSTSGPSANANKKRVIFLGTPEVAATTLQAIHEASLQPDSMFELTAVVTQPEKRRKRNKKPEPSPVAQMAEQLAIPNILAPEKANDSSFLDDVANIYQPDLCITAAYGQYLPKRFLAAPTLGTINIHPSLLPRWRGASPVQRSLQAGDNPVGVSILYTVSAMDAGPIIAQEATTLQENDTATTVLPDLFRIGTKLLLQHLPDILSQRITIDTAKPQDESQVVLATMIDTSEAELRVWEESARTCHNRLRGFSMWPQVYLWLQPGTDRDPIKVKVWQTRVVANSSIIEPTNVVQLGPHKTSGLYVVCFDGTILELVLVQPPTKKVFPARDFQNGYPDATIRWVKSPSFTPDQEVEVAVSATAATHATGELDIDPSQSKE